MFVSKARDSQSSNADPFSIQPPARIGPPRKSGSRAISTQVAAARQQKVVTSLFPDVERAQSQRPAEDELIGGQRVIAERRARSADTNSRFRAARSSDQNHVRPVRAWATPLVARSVSTSAAGASKKDPSFRDGVETPCRDDRVILRVVRPGQLDDALVAVNLREPGVADLDAGGDVPPAHPGPRLLGGAYVDADVAPTPMTVSSYDATIA